MVLKRIAALPGSDARADLTAGLTLRNLEDPEWLACMKRALERPEPEGVVERRTQMRVVSEIARAADMAGRRDLLEGAANRFILLSRRWPARDPILEDETLNPVALAVGRQIERGEFSAASAMLRKAGSPIVDLIPGTLQKLGKSADPDSLAKAALAEGADPGDLGEFLLKVFGRSETVLGVMERGLSKGDARYRLRVACLRAKSGGRDRALELAREGLAGRAEGEVRVSLTLLAARILFDRGDVAGALVLLRPLADGNPDRCAHVAEMMDAAGDDDRSLALYRAAEAQGWTPNSNLARLYQRKGRHEEALNYFERDLKRGSILPAWPADENLGPLPTRPGAASTSAEGRAQVLKALRRE